ncbi:MAG: glycosyltransferase family 2 protein [Porticoccus sp.]|nr:glycosyltransferase family 2 protein [Porticoccus sp.]
MTITLDIIIVNWNAGQQLRDCLESIVSVNHNGFTLGRVVVVDNASSDASLEGIDSLNLQLKIIRNEENHGFGAACNQGAVQCDADYLLFLNPDTRLFENSLAVPLAFMEDEANQGVGICGIQLVDEKGHVARHCANFPSLWRFAAQATGVNKLPGLRGAAVHMAVWDHLSDRSVDHVIGAFFFMRRGVFDALHGFDERFFVYLEDIDLSLRARQTGWRTVYLAGAQAFHQGGGTSQQVKARRLFYSLRSRLLYGFKHFPRWQAWLLAVITMLVEPISRTLFSLLRGGMQDVRNTWHGYGMLYRELPKILKR